MWFFRSTIDESPDDPRFRRGDRTATYNGRFAMNIGLIATFIVVLAGLVFVLYGLIRPFTHIHHDHNDVFHPPHLD